MPDIDELLADTETQLEAQLGQLDQEIASRESEIAAIRRKRRRVQAILRSIRDEPDPPARERARPGANREAILALLREHPRLTAKDIAAHTDIARPTVTAALARLTQEGLVRKERSGRSVRHEAI